MKAGKRLRWIARARSVDTVPQAPTIPRACSVRLALCAKEVGLCICILYNYIYTYTYYIIIYIYTRMYKHNLCAKEVGLYIYIYNHIYACMYKYKTEKF